MNFICTHTDFKEPDGDYVIICNRKLNNIYKLPVIIADNRLKDLEYSYAEGFMIYDIWMKCKEDWIGINHYRRYLSTTEELTLPKPLSFNMHEQYANCHNLNDLLKVEKIIDKYHPEYSCDYKNINVLYPCNMFVMHKQAFHDYCEFVFDVLDKFNEENGLHTDEDVRKYVTRNKSDYKVKFNERYQSRLHGFLMERIGTIFFLKYFEGKDVTYKNIIVTDTKKV